MTCREKLKLEHPEKINGFVCDGCPDHYGYLDKPPYCKEGVVGRCGKCWDREIPEEKEPKSLTQFAGEASEATFEKRKIISQPIMDAMTKFGEKCVEQSKELDKAYESWSHELPEKFKPVVEEISSDEVLYSGKIKIADPEPKKPDGYIDIDAIAKKVYDTCGIPAQIIKDSGDRTEFETGAVRDMREGKGRCDLMPLDVVASVLRDPIIDEIARFQEGGKDVTYLYKALLNVPQSEVFPDVYTMFLEVAKHFEAGCKKYGEDNWRKGIPAKCYIDSAVRHYLKFLRGDRDEPHDRAFVWNILCCIWTVKHLGIDGNGGNKEK